MDEPTKYHLRIVTKTGNAFEALTHMPMSEVLNRMHGPDALGFVYIKAVNQLGTEVDLRVKADNIEGLMHQVYTKVQA